VLVDSSALQLGMGRLEDVDDYDEDFDEMMHGQVVVVAERTLSAVAAKDIVVTAQETRDVVKAFTTDPDRNIDAGALRSVVNKLYKGGGDTAQVGGLTPDMYQSALSAMDAKLSAIMSKLSIKEVRMTHSAPASSPLLAPPWRGGKGGARVPHAPPTTQTRVWLPFDSQVSAIFMESDGPDGGIRDYRAFSASVADVLICLRARDLGKLHCQKSDAAADVNIRHIIAKQDLGKLAQKCYKQFPKPSIENPCDEVPPYFMTDQYESIGCCDLENLEREKNLLTMYGENAGHDIMRFERNFACKFDLQ
jgi:hypothetical protein